MRVRRSLPARDPRSLVAASFTQEVGGLIGSDAISFFLWSKGGPFVLYTNHGYVEIAREIYQGIEQHIKGNNENR